MTEHATSAVERQASNEHLSDVSSLRVPVVEEKFEALRRYFQSGVTKTVEWRKEQLLQLKKLVQTHRNDILSALKTDLGKHQHEAFLTEVGFILSDIEYSLKHLKKWMKTTNVGSPLATFPASSYIKPEPLGVALVIGAWNYPFQLTIAPVVAATAAGNAVVIKPSELSPTTSALIAKLIPLFLDKRAFCVVEGGKEETSGLLELPFNKIFYTGGEHVGKIVMAAAAKNLTPVTLELGGKSPCVVDSSADLATSASRIVWGKFMNAGQTCIAPDYVLVERQVKQQFVDALIKEITRQYGKDAAASEQYGRIVNTRHCQRLQSYLEGQSVVFGGHVDLDDRLISPTLVEHPDIHAPIMQEEIFGPILPIITYDSQDEVKDFIQSRAHPLAAYLFSKDEAFIQSFVDQITCGNMCINDTSMFMVNHHLPFGGVGTSGMGRYHGKYGFDTFSHFKTVMHRSFAFENRLRYAPFSSVKMWLLRKFL